MDFIRSKIDFQSKKMLFMRFKIAQKSKFKKLEWHFLELQHFLRNSWNCIVQLNLAFLWIISRHLYWNQPNLKIFCENCQRTEQRINRWHKWLMFSKNPLKNIIKRVLFSYCSLFLLVGRFSSVNENFIYGKFSVLFHETDFAFKGKARSYERRMNRLNFNTELSRYYFLFLF